MSKKINYKFDSSQEEYFYYWLEELYDNGYIEYIVKDRKSYLLNEPLNIDCLKLSKSKKNPLYKSTTISLIKQRVFTPDFIFKFTDKARGIFCYKEHEIKRVFPITGDELIHVDNKGEYTRHYTSSITFGDRQAIMWDKYKIFVQIVKTYIREGKNCLFEETFTPKKVISKEVYLRPNPKKNINAGDSKIKYKTRTLSEFVNMVNSNTIGK